MVYVSPGDRSWQPLCSEQVPEQPKPTLYFVHLWKNIETQIFWTLTLKHSPLPVLLHMRLTQTQCPDFSALKWSRGNSTFLWKNTLRFHFHSWNQFLYYLQKTARLFVEIEGVIWSHWIIHNTKHCISLSCEAEILLAVLHVTYKDQDVLHVSSGGQGPGE